MSAWLGLEGFECKWAIPHKTKIMRKPKGVGCELKSCADCETKVLLRLEIMEGKVPMSTKDFVQEYGASTAVALRLTKEYFGSGRTVIADSAFSSVKTAEALLQRGLHFIGCVKTASRRFPMAYCTEFFKDAANLRGQHCTLQSEVPCAGGATAPIFAVSWKDKKMKNFIASRGTTLQGSPHLRLRHRRPTEGEAGHTIREQLEVARPAVVEKYFQGFSAIDVHDHYRQGSLGMEMYWPTKTWWHRLFSTIFGMICTDSYLAYCHEFKMAHPHGMGTKLRFDDFLGHVAFNLIKGPFADLSEGISLRNSATPVPISLSVSF